MLIFTFSITSFFSFVNIYVICLHELFTPCHKIYLKPILVYKPKQRTILIMKRLLLDDQLWTFNHSKYSYMHNIIILKHLSIIIKIYKMFLIHLSLSISFRKMHYITLRTKILRLGLIKYVCLFFTS